MSMSRGAMLGHNSISMAMTSSNTSPGQSSPEEFEIEDDSNPAAQWQQEQSSPSQPSQRPQTGAHVHKRRRVTRACDECRRKKIKCDGKQPCTHCTVYSYDCTYDQPSNRRRNPTPQYIEALETRLQRAETLLRSVLPNVDLSGPNIDALIQQHRQGGIGTNPQILQAGKLGNGSEKSEHEAQLRSMIESTGQLDLDEAGHWDFHGGSSGTVFVKRMRERFGNLLGGPDNGAPIFPRMPRAAQSHFDSPKSMTESPHEQGLPNTVDLPSRETAKALCVSSLDSACALLRFVHQPSFYAMFDRVYDVPTENFGDAENRFLPLLYMVLALGCMFLVPSTDTDEEAQNTYEVGIDHGLKYFRAARSMIDIAECRDITSLQAVIFMSLFLQSSSNLSTCYSYIGVALRSALRMGLHRSLSGNFNPIERETRRRVFWIIRKMDTYVSALLGFPEMLSYDDIDQELPIEVDDEYITKDGILDMPAGRVSLLLAAGNAHTRLMSTLGKVIKYIYPIKGLEESLQGSTKSYVISHAKIREIEHDLAEWLDKLPMALRPGGEGSPNVLRSQQLLRLAYAHVQMMLYRPFLHYVSARSCAGKSIDERSYACAAACVSVSRNVVHIATEMMRRGLLVGAYWFTMYTTFFAILSLVYFVLEHPDKPGSAEILADANDGNNALKSLAKRSQAADRCSIALRGLFEQLPERLREGRSSVPAQQRKRSAPSPNPIAQQNLHSSGEALEPVMGAPRATTLPMQAPAPAGMLPKASLENNPSQMSTPSNPNLRESFQDLLTPSTGISPNGTSDATTNIQPQYSMQPQFSTNTAVPDLGAMMFPSNDPFAYPHQPMMQFESIKQENMGMMNGSQVSPMYLPNGPGPSREYDDLQGQLFGPLPPYLSQNQQQHIINPGQMNRGNMMSQSVNYNAGFQPNDDMNFDGIFSHNGEDWSNMLADQRFR